MRPTTIVLPAASGVLITGPGCVTLCTVRAGTTGSLDFYDGNTSGGQLLFTVEATAATPVPPIQLPPHSIAFYSGLYVVVTSWVGAGAVCVISEHSCAAALAAMALLEQG